jgi:hypothetical protein
VISSVEFEVTRKGFHETLLKYGVDYDRLEETGKELGKLSSTKGAGGVIDLFYMDWKLKLNENEKIAKILQELWARTYAINHEYFQHPFETIDTSKAYMAIDRVCFRVPENLSKELGTQKHPLQRSLTPHLDCCPHKRFDGKRWKPIQSFVALTDAMNPNEGGFEACPEFHKGFDDWAAHRELPAHLTSLDQLCVDQFTALRPKEESFVYERFRPIPYKAGDLILWDHRIPHANSMSNQTDRVREVVYLGFLPAVSLNESFARDQWERFQQGILPLGFWHKSDMRQHCSYSFSSFGRKLMTIDPWE